MRGMLSGLMLLGVLPGLLGCAAPAPLVALAAVDVASVMVFGRGVSDLGVSAITGRDCSVVRLDRGQTYCVPIEVAAREVYCTPSLGRVDCWTSPGLLPALRAGVGDTPAASEAQERYRAARWPKSLALE